jgi:autotransporter-associated beta strand protein
MFTNLGANKGAITKNGEGRLTLSGNNSANQLGAIQINAGAVRISNAGALGNTTDPTNITGGTATAVLELTNNISVAETIVIGSKTTAANTTLRNVSGNNTLTGTVTLFGGGTEFNIESEAGLLTINSNLQTPASALRFLNISGAGDVALLGNIQDNGAGTIGLTKSGAGTLALSGTNTYTGSTTLNGGLVTSVANVAVASGSTLKFNGGAISVNSGAGYIQSNGGTVDVNGQTIAAGSYEATLLATSGSKLMNSSASAAIIDGTGNKNTVWINSAGVTIETVGDLDIQSIVTHGSSNNGFTKTGAGTLTLSNTGNSLGSGTVAVSAGTLYLSGNLGAGSVDVGSAGTIGGDGTLTGNLAFLAGADFLFNPTTTLTVNDGTVSFGGFSITDLAGLTNAVANGTYTLIDGTATFDTTNVSNFGSANAYDLGGGKSAYFESGSLNLVVIPEPRAALLGGLGLLALLRRRRG